MKKHKYGAKPKTYKGRKYHSTAEADYAQELDFRQQYDDVRSWVPQPKPRIKLLPNKLKHYTPDFLVTLDDGSQHYVDVKGKETSDFGFVCRAWKYANTHLDLHVVKKKGGKFVTDRIIDGTNKTLVVAKLEGAA